MSEQQSLWPKDFGVETDAPIAILNEQIPPLRKLTKSFVELSIESVPMGDQIVYEVSLYAPVLAYRYPLFKVRHGIESYPAELILSGPGEGKMIVRNKDGFRKALAEIFQSDGTTRAVRNLIAHSAGLRQKA